MDATQRRERIAEQLAQHGQSTVAELSRSFGVSEVTVRADLRALAAARLVRRTRGGAVSFVAAQPPADGKQGVSAEISGSLAAAAADLVQPGDTVVIESSMDVARALGGRTHHITVCTASLDVAVALRGTGITVILAGGTVDPVSGLAGPPQAGPMWEQVTADLAILGCDGVSAAGGVTVADAARAWVWRRCAAMAGRRILIAGAGAVGATAAHVLSDVRAIELCLVPSTVEARRVSALRRAGLTILRTQ